MRAPRARRNADLSMANSSNSESKWAALAPTAALLALMGFHLAANVWWLAADNHPVRTDEETHMLFARDYYEALFPPEGGQGLRGRFEAIARIEPDPGNPLHPPLLHVMGAVLVRVIGYSVDRLAFTNTIFFLLAILGCYKIARRFLPPGEAVFAAAVAAFTPIIFAASRYFMTDYPSMTLCVWALYALIRSRNFACTRWSMAFGALMGLGLLARTTTPLYLLAPAALALAARAWNMLRRGAAENGAGQAAFSRVAMNLVCIAALAASIAAPWYLLHGERFLNFWMHEHRAGSGGPVTLVQAAPPPVQEVTPAEPAPDAPAAEAAEAAEPRLHERWTLRLQRNVPWVRYPVFVINNATFLPLFLLGLAGCGVALAHPRFRRRPEVWMTLAGAAGSYVALTLALSFATPRYALQAMPFFAILAALPILALPRGRPRWTAQCALLALLAFQYVNLTFAAYPAPWDSAKLPWMPDPRMQRDYDDRGLYIYKSRLGLGYSYARLGPPVRENFKDRIFFAILEAERERDLPGIEAAYLRLNMRGMTLDERHFWPDDGTANPYRRRDIPEDLEPHRRIRNYGWGADYYGIRHLLPGAHYVIYSAEDSEEDLERETEWLEQLEHEGFERIKRFREERFGRVPARYFGILARAPEEPRLAVESRADLRRLDFFSLHRFMQTGRFARLAPELQQAAQWQLRALALGLGGTRPVAEELDFVGHDVARVGDNWYRFRFVFMANSPIDNDWRIYFHGKVSDEDIPRLPRHRQAEGYDDWNFNPSPPTSFWPAKEYVVVEHQIDAAPIPYHLTFGFFTNRDGFWGNKIDLEIVDFSAIPEIPTE